MCCILCCFCDYCNRYSSKCMELFIFIISFLSCGFTILEFFFIEKKHITLICFIVLIALIVFSFLILFSIIFILIWRYKQTINNKRHKIAEIFSIIGIVLTILYLICMVSLVSMMYTNFEFINHPCLDTERNENDIKVEDPNNNFPPPKFEENKEEFCKEHPHYNNHIVHIKEYIIAFAFAGVLCILNFLLIYSWFNVYRRIKFLINGSLNDFDAQQIQKNEEKNNENEEDSNDKRINERINRKQVNQLNNRQLYKIYGQQEYGIRYDIYGRPIFKAQQENNKNMRNNDVHNALTVRFSKRKSSLNNRVNIYSKRNSIVAGKSSSNEVIGYNNSSDRNIINKFQFSRNKSNNSNTKSISTNSVDKK